MPQLLSIALQGIDTPARDLRILADVGFTVTRVQPFDLFPHTRHIENVATLERAGDTDSQEKPNFAAKAD